MTSCSCDDFDPLGFYEERLVTARKPHKCYECGEQIEIGEPYWYACGSYSDHTMMTVHTCRLCKDQRELLHPPGSCFLHGELQEEWDEAFR